MATPVLTKQFWRDGYTKVNAENLNNLQDTLIDALDETDTTLRSHAKQLSNVKTRLDTLEDDKLPWVEGTINTLSTTLNNIFTGATQLVVDGGGAQDADPNGEWE